MNVYFCNCDICCSTSYVYKFVRNHKTNTADANLCLILYTVFVFVFVHLCLIPCTETLSLNTGSMISVNLCGSWIVVSRESF